MNNKKNMISALVLQFSTMLQGLILPRFVIASFGSDVNGLISSITQFLSFISLLEGGLGAVVLAELYAPIEKNDSEQIKKILSSCQSFFRKLAIYFIAYTVAFAVLFPIFLAKKYDFFFSCSLVVIISIGTLTQYLFAITNKLFLQASQKLYIVNYTMTLTVILNFILSVVILTVFPNVQVFKLGTAIVNLLQPIIYSRYIDKELDVSKKRIYVEDEIVLKNKRSGFSQNLAYFVNMNTDVAVLSIFASFAEVSVYSIYMLAINSLRSFILSAASSYQSALGKLYAEGDIDTLKEKFSKFEHSFWLASMILFSTCLQMINPFVNIYTSGIHDVDYYRPVFALIMVIANMVYCLREPYRLLVLAAGKFKETERGSTIEACLNMVISIVLVRKLGLVGVAIGTLIAIVYRLLYLIWYLKRDILYFAYIGYRNLFFSAIIVTGSNILLYIYFPLPISTFRQFCISGVFVLLSECILVMLINSSATFFENIKKRRDRESLHE